jgi:AraC family transcriptional regulator of adaptative response/methylated-DNA-[protein]-cysteine methyltransferase
MRKKMSFETPASRNREELHYAVGKSSVGAVAVALSKKGVVAILLDDDAERVVRRLQDCFPKAHLSDDGDSECRGYVKEVVAYIESPALGLDLPLDIRGTAFQKKVWQVVLETPAGETTTYTEVARKIGAPKAMRAVGNACSNNFLALAIPCHRVTRSDGSPPKGEHWGTNRWRVLMEREAGARV